LETQRAILRRAFDRGVTHFDLANNYGPPYGSAESNFGTIFAQDFRPYRDEIVISTKAGYVARTLAAWWPTRLRSFVSRGRRCDVFERSVVGHRSDSGRRPDCTAPMWGRSSAVSAM
jgi:aryl-alcohol dehydrogenase-like predicted oxidoreductase